MSLTILAALGGVALLLILALLQAVRSLIVIGLPNEMVVISGRRRLLEDGREVMAVPGEITSAVSAGSNALLRLGATPVTAAADVPCGNAAVLNPRLPSTTSAKTLSRDPRIRAALA